MLGEGRRELKYIIPNDRRRRVLEIAAGEVQPDAHADALPAHLALGQAIPGVGEARGYRVNTLYLDTDKLHTYTLRLQGAPIRDVVRIRTYGTPEETDAPVFLESKRKLRNRVVKHRTRICCAMEWADASDREAPWRVMVPEYIDHPATKPKGRRLAQRWLEHVEANELRVVCTVHYLREVYVQGRSRLTIDHEVHAFGGQPPCELQGPPGTRLIPDGFLVLELKFDGRKPGWMRRICAELGLVEEPVSKYGLGVAHTERSHREGERRAITPPTLARLERAA